MRLLVGGRPPVLTLGIPPIRLAPSAIQHALRDDGSDQEEDTADAFGILKASGGAAFPSGVKGSSSDKRPLPDDDEESDEETFWAKHAETEEWDDEWEGLEAQDTADIRREVDQIADNPRNVDQNAPTADSETSGRSRAPTYQFCPLLQRKPVLRIYAKTASQHSLLPERHGEARSAGDIHRDAVSEMYYHCRANNLTEVWAYMWNSWYRKDRWCLWARSAYPQAIPRKRTTMIVEALWRGIKRQGLARYNRPLVDFALYSVITKALPPYRLKFRETMNDTRSARAPQLSYVQKDFKKGWTRLSKVPIKGEYKTDIVRWTCDCGSQKYHAHLLCKHLVQAAGPMPASWWPQVVRFHTPPFYTLPVNGVIPKPHETMRNGDWIPRMTASSAIHIPKKIVHVQERAEATDSDVEIPEVGNFRSSSPV